MTHQPGRDTTHIICIAPEMGVNTCTTLIHIGRDHTNIDETCKKKGEKIFKGFTSCWYCRHADQYPGQNQTYRYRSWSNMGSS